MSPEQVANLKRNSAVLSEHINAARSTLAKLTENFRSIDSTVTTLLAENVRSVNRDVASYQASNNPGRALEGVTAVLDAARELVNAARTAQYAEQREPAIPRG